MLFSSLEKELLLCYVQTGEEIRPSSSVRGTDASHLAPVGNLPLNRTLAVPHRDSPRSSKEQLGMKSSWQARPYLKPFRERLVSEDQLPCLSRGCRLPALGALPAEPAEPMNRASQLFNRATFPLGGNNAGRTKFIKEIVYMLFLPSVALSPPLLKGPCLPPSRQALVEAGH